ncbi:MAG TPA: GAF domain-containing protein [Trichocoleus sp.]
MASEDYLRQLEGQLHQFTQLQAALQDAFEVAPTLFCVMEEDGRLQLLSPNWQAVMGWEVESAQLQNWFDWVYPDDRASVRAILRTLAKKIGQSRCSFTARMRHQDGSDRYLSWQMKRGRAGWLYGVARVELSVTYPTQQTTDDRQLSELTRQREEEFRALVENSPDVIMRLDQQFRYVYINPRIEQEVGIAPADFIGKSNDELGFPANLVAFWHQAMAHVFATGEEWHHDYSFVTSQGEKYWSSRIVPEFGATGVETVLVVARDITEFKQASEALRQQADRERLVGMIVQRIRQSLEPTEILTTTAAEVRHFLAVDRVVIFQFYPDWSGKIVVESVRPGCPPLLDQVIDDPCFGNGWHELYRQGRIGIVEDAETDNIQSCYRELLTSITVRANLIVPILQDDRLWGLLGAHSCETPRHWQDSEISLLSQIAAQVGIAIQQSELYQQVRTLNTTLEVQVQQRTAQLQQAFDFEATLKRVTDKVRDSLDEAQILQTAVQELTLALNIYSCDTGIYDEQRQTSTIAYEYTVEKVPPATCNVVPISNFPEIYQPLMLGECLQFCWHSALYIAGTPVRPIAEHFSVLVCPLICPHMKEHQVLGDLWLYKAAAQVYGEQEVRLIQQVANQCAIAIRQARLFHAAQTQVIELERLNRLKDNFLSSISHELRTPISNIKMATQMIELCLSQLNLLTEEQTITRYFRILKEESQREICLINDLLDLSRLDANSEPLMLTTIDPAVWIRHVSEPFMQRAQSRQQQLRLHIPADLPLLTTDLTNLERILTELLNNACKYTPPNETIMLLVEVIAPETHSPILCLRISNSGVDIPPEEHDRIFDKFYRIPTHDPWKHEGTGLGLALVKKLVERLEGTIAVESGDHLVTFVVRIPLQSSQNSA